MSDRDAGGDRADRPVGDDPPIGGNGSAGGRNDPGGDGSLAGRLRYLLVLSRPRFWIYLAGPVLVGAVYGADSTADLADPAAVALFAYFLVPANVFLYGLNDVFDREVDAANPKKEGRERRYRGQPFVPAVVVACAILPLLALPWLPAVSWPWIVLFLALGAAYSAPPARLKTTPPLDSVSNGLYVAPGGAAYAALSGTHPPALAVVGGWLWTMGMHTFSAIPDVEPDREAGIRTTATALGERRTYAYCAGCWLAAAAAFAAIDPRLGAPLLVYPALAAGVATANVTVDRAYWWFPAINALVGAVLTVGGLWVVVRG